ncbi:MAG: SPOR domain-containing protein [Steroidobacteraceae bacterium]|jgi:DedD protein
MENRLKERLTGAAILVALVVMLVPEMFHGQRGDVATIAGSSGEGPPVRSYTIDLSNSPTRAGPLQSTPAGGGSGSNDDKPTTVPAPEQPTAVTTTAADGAVTASRLAAAAAAPSHGAQGGWGVQLGLFAKRDNAERLAHAAQTQGFAVSVSSADAKGLYRVFAGGMADRAAAEAYSQRLKDHGFAAAVVASP